MARSLAPASTMVRTSTAGAYLAMVVGSLFWKTAFPMAMEIDPARYWHSGMLAETRVNSGALRASCAAMMGYMAMAL